MSSNLLKGNIADSVLVKLGYKSTVFVLMQFDPGMEYRPDWGSTKVPLVKGANLNQENLPPTVQHGIQRGATKLPPNANIKGPTVGGPAGGPPNKDDKS